MKARWFLVLAVVGACAMPAAQLPAGRSAMAGAGGVIAPARVTVATADGEERVRGNGGSYGEVHPLTYVAQQQYAIDVPFGDRCRPGVVLSWIGRNGVTGRCDPTPWWTIEAHAAWQIAAGPVAHVGTAAQRRVGPITLVGGVRASVGRYLHVLTLPSRFAEDAGFEAGMGGARARFERDEVRLELPLGVFLDGDPPLSVAIVPYAVIGDRDVESRCDGCRPGVTVGDYEERWGIGLILGFGGRADREPR